MISTNKLYDPIFQQNLKNKDKSEYKNFVESYLTSVKIYDDSKINLKNKSLSSNSMNRESSKSKFFETNLNLDEKTIKLVNL